MHIETIVVIILLACSAFFSASEAALMSLSKHKLHHLKKKRTSSIKALVYLKKNPGIMLATILIGNNIVNIAIASIATLIALTWFHHLGIDNPLYVSPVTTFVTTAIVLVFGEVLPKTLALPHASRVALFASPLISVLSFVFRPFVIILNALSNVCLRLLGGRSLEKDSLVSEEEILSLIAAGEESGSIKKEEKEMLEDVLEFGDKLVGEVMTHLDNVIAFEEHMSLPQMIALLKERTPSRIPVYAGKKTNIYGLVYLKDLIFKFDQLRAPESFILKDNPELIRKPFVVQMDQKTTEVLKAMKFHRVHVAVVRNHASKVIGILTIEDLIEEIVGDIQDEYEVVNPLAERRHVEDGFKPSST